MSSRLMRGDSIATEPVAWRRVSSTEAITGDGQPAPGYISEPGIPSGADTRKEVDIEQRLVDAHQKGFYEGQAAGRQSRTPEVEAMQVKLARSIEDLTGARPRYRREAERDVVALALAIARRILHRELTVAPEALLGLVKAALEKLEARELHQVRVSSQDAAMVRQFFEQMGLPQRVEVLADPNLVPGSVILESGQGLLDASVDTQLAEIDRGLADLVP
ncbi:MAG TPA: FliH/SctL family protein [Bryobacteraceae bacterium]|nr:FliH/SctL family protein [Bryobacteraceae bacterium]